MGWRKGDAATDDGELSRSYVSQAPPGPRTTCAVAAVYQATVGQPAADATRFGTLPTDAELLSIVRLVESVLVQDRSITVVVARQTVAFTNALTALLPGGPMAAAEMYFAANGIDWSGDRVALLRASDGDAPGSEHLLRVAGRYEALMAAVVMGQRQAPKEFWSYYVALHVGSGTREKQAEARDLIAFAAIAFGRLRNAGRFDMSRADPSFAAFDPRYSRLVQMSEPGWYPNPPKVGTVVGAEAPIQRYWDGNDWTSRVRRRQGRSWSPIHNPLDMVPQE